MRVSLFMSDSESVCDNVAGLLTPGSKHSRMIPPKLGPVQPGDSRASQEPLKERTPAVSPGPLPGPDKLPGSVLHPRFPAGASEGQLTVVQAAPRVLLLLQ
jgi:hypothetical protein